jgi:hypothetical protein
MANYAYKLVWRLLPDHILEDHQEDLDCNYEAGLWYAAADYIEELRAEIAELKNDLEGFSKGSL